MSSGDNEINVGRREYDKLQADYVALGNQMSVLISKFTEFQIEMKSELAAVRSENKEILGVWTTAKGTSAFIIWLGKLLVAAGIIAVFFKWGPLK